MNILYFFFSLISGAGATLQAGINGTLRSTIGSPIFASLVSFFVGFLGLAITYGVAVFLGYQTFPAMESIKSGQWWVWTGGLLGAVFVFLTVIIPPKIGYANMFCLIVAGQIILAVVFDHFGLFGNAVRLINPYRAGGIALLILSVYIIQKY